MEHAAGNASGQAGDARPAGREPAGADWRAAECRNQTIWYVALEAVRRAKFVPQGPPRPFGLDDPRCLDEEIDKCVKVLHDTRWATLAFEPRTPAEVLADFRAVIGTVAAIVADPGRQRGIAAASGWRASECVRWWTEAAELLRACRAAIPRIQQHEALAAAKSGREGGFAKLRGKASAPRIDTTPSWRLQALFAAVRDRLGDQDPVLWIADQEGPLQFGAESLDEPGVQEAGVDPPGETTTRRDCLEWLVAACAALRRVPSEGGGRQNCSPKMFQAWRSGLVEKAGRLLGAACREGPDPWRAGDLTPWDVHVVGEMAAEVLARPLLVEDPGGDGRPRLLAKGVVIVPRADKLVDRLRSWCGEGAEGLPDRGTVTAVEMVARHGWGGRFSELLFKQARPRSVTIDALLGFVRLLVAAEAADGGGDSGPASGPLGLPEEFRLVTRLEGLSIQAGGPGIARRIPLRQGPRHEAGAALALRLRGGALLPIGVPSEPAACGDDIFAAIEDLDWRLWAIAAAATSRCLPISDDDRDQLGKLLQRARHDDWEAVKTRLLRSDPNPATLAEAVRHLVHARLRLEATSMADDLSEVLVDDTRRLERALLGRLHDLDPDSLGELHPPRGRDGAIDVFRWRAGAVLGEPRLPTWTMRWQADRAPFGGQLAEEVMNSKTIGATFSASPGATEADVRLLEAPFVSNCPRNPAGTCFEPLARFGLEVVSPAGHVDGMPDMAAALMRLREALGGPDREAFDGLIKAATSSPPDPDAVRWVRLLHGDPRFAFACHPPIAAADGEPGFTVGPPSSGDELAWEDSDTLPEGADVRVIHALARQHGLRVLSRGRPTEGSAEHLAAELEAVCDASLLAMRPAAGRIREAIDRLRTFPAERAGVLPALAESLAAALDELVQLAAPTPAAGADASATDGRLARAFGILARIAALHGHGVTPEAWHPRTGTPAPGPAAAADLAAVFHPTVPSGGLVVERFGIAGEQGREGRCRRSAGPAPAGYEALRGLAGSLPGDEPRCRELLQVLDDLPRHVLDEKARLAIPSIYDSVWKVLVEHPAVAGDQAPWKAAIAELIRKPFDMVMFEPGKLGDYPTSWIVEAGGRAPRGRHIVRVVRPGVRTLEKKLVWPAVVETE